MSSQDTVSKLKQTLSKVKPRKPIKISKYRLSKNGIIGYLHEFASLPPDECHESVTALVVALDLIEAGRDAELAKQRQRDELANAAQKKRFMLFAQKARERCPKGFIRMSRYRSADQEFGSCDLYHGSRFEVLLEAIGQRPNCIFVIEPGFSFDELYGHGSAICNNCLVFAKDIGTPAYECIERPEGVAIVLTKAGLAASRKLGVGNLVAKAS